MENLRIEHVAEEVAVYASYFLDVSNVAFLQSQLVARNPDFEYALIDASAILSRNHLLAAIFSAATAMVDGSLKTPNVHSEIVYSLSPASNIAEAYRRFGISPDTRNVIVVKVLRGESRAAATQVQEHVREHVLGKPASLTEENIQTGADMGKLTKYYKLGGVKTSSTDETARRKDLETHVIAAMALRGL